METFYDSKISDIKKKYVEILIFLNKYEGIDLKKIAIIDESTSTLRNK